MVLYYFCGRVCSFSAAFGLVVGEGRGVEEEIRRGDWGRGVMGREGDCI